MIDILVVDDEEDILFTIKYGLEKIDKNYKIKTVSNGDECLKALKEGVPDLILLDLMMPNMNGWQVLDIILSNSKWRNIPVFIISGAGNNEFKEQAEALGIPLIEKPFTIDLLKDRIDNFFMNKK
jgi:CheY-like chemotaxis protein